MVLRLLKLLRASPWTALGIPFFVPAYLLCSLLLRLRGRDGYRDNPFEIRARLAADTPGRGA